MSVIACLRLLACNSMEKELELKPKLKQHWAGTKCKLGGNYFLHSLPCPAPPRPTSCQTNRASRCRRPQKPSEKGKEGKPKTRAKWNEMLAKLLKTALTNNFISWVPLWIFFWFALSALHARIAFIWFRRCRRHCLRRWRWSGSSSTCLTSRQRIHWTQFFWQIHPQAHTHAPLDWHIHARTQSLYRSRILKSLTCLLTSCVSQAAAEKKRKVHSEKDWRVFK